jgi:hypothetical protein
LPQHRSPVGAAEGCDLLILIFEDQDQDQDQKIAACGSSYAKRFAALIKMPRLFRTGAFFIAA